MTESFICSDEFNIKHCPRMLLHLIQMDAYFGALFEEVNVVISCLYLFSSSDVNVMDGKTRIRNMWYM